MREAHKLWIAGVSAIAIVANAFAAEHHAAPLPTRAAQAGPAPPAAPAASPAVPDLAARPTGVDSSTFSLAATARLPGFAPQLAQRPTISFPAGWTPMDRAQAWDAIGLSTPENRQEARWNYALGLIAQAASGFGDDLGGAARDALGVLDVMGQDDPDLLLVPSFRLARGLALVRVERPAEALAMLDEPMLIAAPEACLWRMMAYHQLHREPQALGEMRCAVRAINARTVAAARPFILAAADAAVEGGIPAQAIDWLALLPDRDAQANLFRGRALMKLGKAQDARLRLERAQESKPAPPLAAEIEIALLEGLAPRQIPVKDALARLDHLRFTWRGGEVEERALRLGYRLAEDSGNRAASLDYGATLLRYFDNGDQAGAILAQCQSQLMAALADGSNMPLAQSVGLFWTYRDLAPSGTQGDALLLQLARRLADARLYERAADLLSYQMNNRARDIEKGPVSEQAARFYILAGKPAQAIDTLRASDQPAYPADMLAARQRLQAIALWQLGDFAQALSLLDDMPDTVALRGEMLWRRRDWQGLVARLGDLPASRRLTPVDQAMILRQAVALNMLAREGELARMRARYGAAFSASPSAAAFALLTGPLDQMTPDGIARAMAAIPSASVAGDYEAMLNARPEPVGAQMASATPAKHPVPTP